MYKRGRELRQAPHGIFVSVPSGGSWRRTSPRRARLAPDLGAEHWEGSTEYRRLGRSGLYVSAMTLGTMTFGGRGDFGMVGSTDVATATRQVDACLDAGVNLFDTADMYSDGESAEILGQAISGRRDSLLLATNARMAVGAGAESEPFRAKRADKRRRQPECADKAPGEAWRRADERSPKGVACYRRVNACKSPEFGPRVA